MASSPTRIALVLVAVAVLLASAQRVEACSRITGAPICETFWKTSVVFAGEVLEIRDAPEPIGGSIRAARGDGRIAARLVNADGEPAVGYRLEVISLEALEANRIPLRRRR